MKANIEYGNIVIFSYAIVFVILGTLNLLGMINGATILIFSIDAFLLAVVQLMDSIMTIQSALYSKAIRTILCLLNGWYFENRYSDKDVLENKRKEFVENKNRIMSSFEMRIRRIAFVGNIIISVSIVFTIIALSTKFMTENSRISDALSLISFAIVFLGISINSYANKYIDRLEKVINETESKLSTILDKDVEL